MRRLFAWLSSLLVGLWLVPTPAIAQKQTGESAAAAANAPAEGAEKPKSKKTAAKKYLRLRRDDKKKIVAMETAIIRFASPKHPGVTVDLVGAIHLADKKYYEQLNNRFREYDALLYELVAPPGARPVPGRPSGSTIGGMQVMMKRVLKLQFQLDCIDYNRPNFVHADMSPKEFQASMKKRGESFFKLFMRMLGQSIAQQAKSPPGSQDLQIAFALLSRDPSEKLKQVLAEQFQEMELTMAALNGPDGTTIITERNKKALSVLERELKAGKKRLGIFYGAGHFPDMEKRLIDDFGFRPVGTQWLTAWDLRPKSERKPPR